MSFFWDPPPECGADPCPPRGLLVSPLCWWAWATPLEGSAASSGWGRMGHSTPQGNIHTHEVDLTHDPGKAPQTGAAALVTPKTCKIHFQCMAAQLSLYLQECEDLLLITSFMLSAPESSSSSVKRPVLGAPGLPWIRIFVTQNLRKCSMARRSVARSKRCMTRTKRKPGNMQRG